MKDYKVYILACPKTNDPRYVGITRRTLAERLTEHLKKNKNKKKIRWISSLEKEGLTPLIILKKDGLSYSEAIEHEHKLIKSFAKKYKLLNHFGLNDKHTNRKRASNCEIYFAIKNKKVKKVFASLGSAAKEIGASPSAIKTTAWKNKNLPFEKIKYETKGYVWLNTKNPKSLTEDESSVAQYKDGKCIAVYKNIPTAAEITQIRASDIKKCCTGEKGTAKGYVWVQHNLL